jgi:hypothetical protein
VKETVITKEEHQASDIQYVAAMLTRESQKNLYNVVSKLVDIPEDWKKYCHHMTTRFQPEDDDQLPVFGEEISIVVTEYAADDKGIAVKVEPNTDRKKIKMPAEQLPHVTIAVAPGTGPVYSNKLLAKGSNKKMPEALILQAYMGAKLNKGPVVPERKDAAYESF